MKRLIPIAAAVLLSGACSHVLASADANVKLAESRQCFQCHAVDARIVGPSFRTIGAIYRPMKDPVPKLVAMIRDGSDAHLGSMWDGARMPDDSQRPPVSEREARQLARWILSQKP